ncbi:MAG: MBL fold metallo-hydrolase [Gammaproteobacteria bacterium]|nr:MBL fold metallo-hydrolase [Gammaproteobacteria bacterium]
MARSKTAVLSLSLVSGLLGLVWLSTAVAQTCGTAPVQVLGSGGPELRDRRASSSYLVWLEGKPRVLVDIGGGAALRFGESGATVSYLDVILLTHLHADHTADLPALIKSSFFEDRSRTLPIYGPAGNKFMPSTVTFVRTLFDSVRGAYRYLGDFLNPLARGGYKLQPQDVHPLSGKLKTDRKPGDETVYPFANERLRASAVPVAHGNLPALAWRIDAGGKSMIFSGDTSGHGEQLARLAQGADLLIAHNAVPEGASGVERELHMPPSVIGAIAQQAQVKQLVLSHRMLRTLGKEEETLVAIRRHYAGPAQFANDLDCFTP